MARKNETYHHGDLRNALVSAAASLLADVDAGSLSLRQAAERVGVSHAAAYRHFRDKDDLLAAVSEAGFARLRERVAEARQADAADHRSRLARMAEAYLDFAVAEPGAYRLMFGAGFLDRLRRSGVDEAARLAFAELLEAIREAQAAGEVREGSPFLLSNTAWALLHGLSLFCLDGPIERDSRAAATSASWNFLWQGLSPAPLRT